MIRQWFADYRAGLKRALDSVPTDTFEEMVSAVEKAYREDRQIFLMGNGGSAATASHAVCDLNKGVSFGLEKRLRAICLNDNLPTTMAYANDLSYDDVFVEPLKNFLSPGDLVIGISGSGNSRNVLKAIDYANSRGAHTIGLTGYDGGKLARLVRTSVRAPVDDMQKAEDIHLILFHVLTQVLAARLRTRDLGVEPLCRPDPAVAAGRPGSPARRQPWASAQGARAGVESLRAKS